MVSIHIIKIMSFRIKRNLFSEAFLMRNAFHFCAFWVVDIPLMCLGIPLTAYNLFHFCAIKNIRKSQ